jgi:prolyl-tRNA synthetase
MLHVYLDLVNHFVSLFAYYGEKPEHEKFAGAVHTYTFEPMMKDYKALQSGTSHNLGQNFAKAFGVQFTDQNNELQYPYATSWGVSTRLMGGLVMAHSDDKGLVLPPAIAPLHLVVVPIAKNEEDLQKIKEYLAPELEKIEKSEFSIESECL